MNSTPVSEKGSEPLIQYHGEFKEIKCYEIDTEVPLSVFKKGDKAVKDYIKELAFDGEFEAYELYGDSEFQIDGGRCDCCAKKIDLKDFFCNSHCLLCADCDNIID